MSIDWQPPSELPDLRRVGIIALDTETRDGGLFADRGSAWPWGDGYICGVSVAWRDENDIRTIYVPVRHPDRRTLTGNRSFVGCATYSRPMCASSRTTDSMIMAGYTPISDSTCQHLNGSKRLVHWRPSSTRTVLHTSSPRYALGVDCPAKTKPCSGKPARRSI